MRFAIISKFGCGLSLWKRLQDEGNEVAVFSEPKNAKKVGKGIVPLAGSWPGLLQWAKDGALRGIPTIVFSDSSGLGKEIEEARKWGLPVVGGGRFPDRLEQDRAFGFEVAERAGCRLPPHQLFPSFEEALKFAKGLGDGSIYFKSDRFIDSDATHQADSGQKMAEYLEYVIRRHGAHGRCILQEKVEGVAFSTARWWNGRTWVGPYEFTIEHKKLMNDDKGPSTGCSLNAIWFDHNARHMAEGIGWERLGLEFMQHDAPPGLYDANAVVTPQGDVYFLEWTPRFGFDSEPTSTRLFPDFGGTLATVAYGTGEPAPRLDVAYAVRLSMPPYPWEHLKHDDLKTPVGTYISGEVGDLWSGPFQAYDVMLGDNGYEMAAPEGIVGLSWASGKALSKAVEAAEKAAEALDVPGLMYRTDGLKTLQKDAKELEAAGCEIPPSVLR